MVRVWHDKNRRTGDILLRLLCSNGADFPGICQVHSDGTLIRTLGAFSNMSGRFLTFAFDAQDLGEDEEIIYAGKVPRYKIWHEKHQALVRLRLHADGESVDVWAVNTNGTPLGACSILIQIYDKRGQLCVYCVPGCIDLKTLVPLDSHNKLVGW